MPSDYKFKRCPRCHAVNPADSIHCRKCGFPLTETASSPREQKSGTWELGDISVPDDDGFSLGDEDALDRASRDGKQPPTAQKSSTHASGSVWVKKSPDQPTLGVSKPPREKLVDTLRTIERVIKRRGLRQPEKETVKIVDDEASTIDSTDPFSELALQSTVRAHEPKRSKKLNAKQREAAAYAATVAPDTDSLDPASSRTSQESAPIQPSEPQQLQQPTVSQEQTSSPQPASPIPEVSDEDAAPIEHDTVEMKPSISDSSASRPLESVVQETIERAAEPSVVYTTSTSEVIDVEVVGFWSRAAAWLIDLLIALVPVMLIVYFSLSAVGKSDPLMWLVSYPARGALRAVLLTSALWLGVYFTVFTWLGCGATFGKQLLGIRVIDFYGEPPGPGRSLLRCLLYVLDTILFGLGFLLIFVSSTRQTLHDKIVSTIVVKD